MIFVEVLKAIILGVVEGITEWLPVSSTGHLIILDELLHLNGGITDIQFREQFLEMFNVVIQLGAILAVLVIFFDKLNPISKKKSAEQGKFMGSQAPYGYMKSPEDKHLLIIDEENRCTGYHRCHHRYLPGTERSAHRSW